MALGDWNKYGDTAAVEASNNRATDGSYSLRHADGRDGLCFVVWPDSESTAPTRAEVITQAYTSGFSDASYCALFRFQDANNHYKLWTEQDGGAMVLQSVVGGSANTVASTTGNGPGKGSWVRLKFVLWTDGTGDVRAQIHKWDGSEFVQFGSDLVDTGNAITSGGGVGVTNEGPTVVYYDETEVHY